MISAIDARSFSLVLRFKMLQTYVYYIDLISVKCPVFFFCYDIYPILYLLCQNNIK